MDWVWDIIEKYRHNELQTQLNSQSLTDTLSSITQVLTSIANNMFSIQRDINILKESQSPKNKQLKQLQNKRYSYWTSKMFPKYQLLMEHFGITQHKELYKQLYWELQNTYPDIELNQIIDDYCYENHLDSCFTLDAIEHDKTVRILFERMVDNLLEKYNLTPKSKHVKYKTIFDE